MWFYDRQHGQWSLSDHVSEPWAGEEAHPGPPNLSGKMKRVSPIFLQDSTIPASQASSSVTCAMRTVRYTTRSGTVSMCLHRGSVVAGLPPLEMMHREMDRANSPAGVTPPLPMLQAPCWPSWRRRSPPRRGSILPDPGQRAGPYPGATAVWLTERVGLDRLRVLASHGIDVKEYALCDMPCQQLYRQGASCAVP